MEIFNTFNPQHLYWFLAYVLMIIVAVGVAQHYASKVPWLVYVKGLFVPVLYALAAVLIVQFGLPLIGINVW